MAKKKVAEKEVIYCRPQISDAISWALIYQIMRRYQRAFDFRLYELHPGGGQYDCLSLHSRIPGKPQIYFDFNLSAQSLHICLKDRFDIVDDYLRAEDPKDILDLICRTAGLDPDILPSPSNGPILATGVMAGLVQMNIFSRRHLKFFMGAEDTSGYGGGVRSALAKFTLTAPLVEGKNLEEAYRYFYLLDTNDPHDNPLCLFDMAGKVIFRNDLEIKLLPAYAEYGHNINILTAETARRIEI